MMISRLSCGVGRPDFSGGLCQSPCLMLENQFWSIFFFRILIASVFCVPVPVATKAVPLFVCSEGNDIYRSV